MTTQTDWLNAFAELQCLSNELGVGDPFNYNRGREIHTAFTLGLRVSDTLSGADAYIDGQPVELKSTIGNLKATYNGISVQPTWDEQVEYLATKKIGKYKYHYIVRYDADKLVEAYRLLADDVMMLLLPKFKKQYHNTKVKADPRLGAQLTKEEILTYGERIK